MHDTVTHILIASDHAGFALKRTLIEKLSGHYQIEDLGPFSHEEGDDYPPFIAAVASRIGTRPDARGIVIGGSGQGEAMVANRFPNVRAAVYYGGPFDIVRLSREHNAANVLSLGARFLSEDEALHAVMVWLETPFSNQERHLRRIRQIESYPDEAV